MESFDRYVSKDAALGEILQEAVTALLGQSLEGIVDAIADKTLMAGYYANIYGKLHS